MKIVVGQGGSLGKNSQLLLLETSNTALKTKIQKSEKTRAELDRRITALENAQNLREEQADPLDSPPTSDDEGENFPT